MPPCPPWWGLLLPRGREGERRVSGYFNSSYIPTYSILHTPCYHTPFSHTVYTYECVCLYKCVSVCACVVVCVGGVVCEAYGT